ncbi:MAG: hypothetical protein COB59_06755 [Rhodospirillaceae bacterium]|nr:MAG: hypothetical protein COB59_06755 [Rhodospirillaceae bacterium]
MSKAEQMYLGRWARVSGLVVVTLLMGACTPNLKHNFKVSQESVAVEALQAPEAVEALDVAEPDPVGAEAQYRFAVALLKANANDPAAQKWLERAAMQGQGDAAYILGEQQVELGRQIDWYSMAAAVGQVDAQYALGDAYLNGRGTAIEPAWGLSWLERAARAGHSKAQFSMGVAMATGMTGAPQREEGLVWLLIAQKNGFEHAAPVISTLKARLKKSVFVQSNKRAKAWTKEPAEDAENKALVRFVQYALGRMGFNAGLADGLSGDRTQLAVQAFRKAQGLGKGGIDGVMVDILRERLAVFKR